MPMIELARLTTYLRLSVAIYDVTEKEFTIQYLPKQHLKP